MTRPRLICGLRIAWTVWWGVAAVLLCVLWVRSYWWFDNANFSATGTVVLNSLEGAVGLVYSDTASNKGLTSITVEDVKPLINPKGEKARKWLFDVHPTGTWVSCPYWFAALLLGLLAVGPWIRSFRQFSLRTLLIAMTLIAIVMGLVVTMRH